MTRELWKGNEAIAEASLRAGLEAYFGYPITPQTEILEYLSRRMPELGRAFVQAESELGAINMVYGAACAGVRVMSTSSSPGVSLMMEGLSYIAGTEVPAVLVNVMRGGPGLGNIAPAQADYNQAVHGGGHGDYRNIVLAPASVQEAIDLMALSFDLAEKYRSICMVILDGCIGQMMEPAQMPEMRPIQRADWDWATDGRMGKRERRILTSIYLDPPEEEKMNLRQISRWRAIQANEVRYKEYFLEMQGLSSGSARGAWRSQPVPNGAAGIGGCADHPSPARSNHRTAAERERVPGDRDELRSDARRCPPGGKGARAHRILWAHGRRGAAPGRNPARDPTHCRGTFIGRFQPARCLVRAHGSDEVKHDNNCSK
jgi:hypothetical protein